MTLRAIDNAFSNSQVLKDAIDGMAGMGKDSLWMKLGMLCVSLVVALIIAEVALRLFVPFQQQRDTEHVFFTYDEELGWANLPGSSGVFSIPSGTTVVNISAEGWRDTDLSAEKAPGTKRILVLGDSQTWGYGVNQDERFSDHLKTAFDNADVLNMGVSGYGTAQEDLQLRTRGLAYQPDIVVVAFYSNDLFDNLNDGSGATYEYPRPTLIPGNGSLRVTNQPVPKKAALWEKARSYYDELPWWSRLPMKYSRVFFLTKQVIDGASRAMVRAGWQDEIPASFRQPDSPSWTTAFAILDDMNTRCQEAGCTLVVAVIPTERMLEANETVVEDQLVAWGKNTGVPVIPMASEFNQRGLDTLYLKYDSHLSKAGHTLAGELIADKLNEIDSGLIAAS